MAEFVDTRPVELAVFRCPRCRRKMEELARARLTCPLCGVCMVKEKGEPSAEVRCKCGGRMKGECIEPRRRRENARARDVMRETAAF